MQSLEVKRTRDRLHQVLLPPCGLGVLRRILLPDVPFVWILNYHDETIREWCQDNVPLPVLDEQEGVQCQVRRLEMDLCLSTSAFLAQLSSFGRGGIDLAQAYRPLPSDLRIDVISAWERARIYRQNGIELTFYLPHDMEHALVKAPLKETLEEVIERYGEQDAATSS